MEMLRVRMSAMKSFFSYFFLFYILLPEAFCLKEAQNVTLERPPKRHVWAKQRLIRETPLHHMIPSLVQ